MAIGSPAATSAPWPRAHKKRELAVWQERFWEHQIRDDADDARHVDYVHYNPVKHGLVAEALIGRIQRFIVTSGSVCIHRIGQVPRCHVTESGYGEPDGLRLLFHEHRRLYFQYPAVVKPFRSKFAIRPKKKLTDHSLPTPIFSGE
jgi:hypothetical protein